MAKKRPEFSFPELEHRGRNAILRSTQEVQAEEALLEEAPESTVESLGMSQPTPGSEAAESRTVTPATSVRARTRASKSAATPSLSDRLRQRLRSKQHLSSYTF